MHNTFPAAVHILFIRHGRVLLLRRCNTGYEDGKYSLVAGHLDGSETLKQAAIREAKEEVGVDIAYDQLEFVGTMHRMASMERLDFFLTALAWNPEPSNQELSKCDDIGWFSFTELPRNTIPYIKRAIENYCANKHYDEFGWEERRSFNAATL
jgi:8-oxo-dGTP diphosphatase